MGELVPPWSWIRLLVPQCQTASRRVIRKYDPGEDSIMLVALLRHTTRVAYRWRSAYRWQSTCNSEGILARCQWSKKHHASGRLSARENTLSWPTQVAVNEGRNLLQKWKKVLSWNTGYLFLVFNVICRGLHGDSTITLRRRGSHCQN